MAFSAHKDAEQMQEFECNEATLSSQAAELAKLIASSKHFIAFTGAGISTSSGIPDFRGPQGVWTLRAKGEFPKSRQSTLSAVPTIAHMALVGLEQAGLLKFLVSQNTDGLHRRSGFPPHKLAELHGNSNLEQCRNCKRNIFEISQSGVQVVCMIIKPPGNVLLPEKPLRDSFQNGRIADLCLVLGSSLTVSPANRIPQETAERGGKLVICNMQKTPLDSLASLRVFSKTDALMQKTMQYLGIPIPEWVLRRWIHVSVKSGTFENTSLGQTFSCRLKVMGVEPDGTPASILRRVDLVNTGQSMVQEPFQCFLQSIPQNLFSSCILWATTMSHHDKLS
uniref:protein acetyllysine N-acetyltransferase n=1 Tax=Ditylenchus dipsaci TaxID=166011 RepID=A0A915EPZ7_9BILA